MLTYVKAAGIQESELGDLFLSGADICGVAGIQAAEKLAAKGVDVRGLPFSVKVVDPYEIALPGQQAKPIRATVNSMRFDAVAACGFPASRTRLAAEIELGRAKLNGKVVTDSAAKIKQGDVIVMRGRGRLTVDEEGPVTKKGRLSIRISRYSAI
jgi:RNA-binding protein YlmH